MAKFSLLLLSVLLAACSKDGNEEEGLEPPLGLYELSVYPSEAGLYTREFFYADGDESVFSDTLFIKGGTPLYRIEPVREIIGINGSVDAKAMDVFDFTTVRSSAREADQLIVTFVYHKVNPDFDLSGPITFLFEEFILYDKNGGYVKFDVRNRNAYGDF